MIINLLVFVLFLSFCVVVVVAVVKPKELKKDGKNHIVRNGICTLINSEFDLDFCRNLETRCWRFISYRAINAGHPKCAFKMWIEFNGCQIRNGCGFHWCHVYQRQFL